MRPRPESNQRTWFRKPMLYPLSYEGGRWRKGGAKPPASIPIGDGTGASSPNRTDPDLLDHADPLAVAHRGHDEVLQMDRGEVNRVELVASQGSVETLAERSMSELKSSELNEESGACSLVRVDRRCW